ncbi:MAG: diaminopimelate epimerase [Planctomycetes bacterium]|nr:diaminopimelate epimerase [Planctomycetota bacterium]
MLFTKMEGLGNDYVYVDGIGATFPLERGPELARRWSDRHFGIGADGLIVLATGTTAPIRMVMWNADGSRGAMCGNGLRCLARFAFDQGHLRERRFTVETDSGLRRVELLDDGLVRAGMGTVTTTPPITVAVAGRALEFVCGDAGNPHAVHFVADTETVDVGGIGAALQRHAAFPDGVNVEFVQVLGPDRLRQRTFERGSGETLACGTGAAVAAIAARAAGKVHGETTFVELRGGVLRVVGAGSSLAIEGPSRTVFRGEVELPA